MKICEGVVLVVVGDRVLSCRPSVCRSLPSLPSCFAFMRLLSPEVSSYPDPWKDPESRSPNSGLQDSYSVDYRTFRGIYFLDPSGVWVRDPLRFKDLASDEAVPMGFRRGEELLWLLTD